MPRQPTYPDEQLRPTSINMTNRQRILFRRLGGSQWLRDQIEKASNESTDQSRLARIPDDTVGKTELGG